MIYYDSGIRVGNISGKIKIAAAKTIVSFLSMRNEKLSA
jgi:hypothetical protein